MQELTRSRVLDLFGRKIVTEVTQRIEESLFTIAGLDKDSAASRPLGKFSGLSALNAEQTRSLVHLIEESAVVATHALLDLVERDAPDEGERDRMILTFRLADGQEFRIAELSDGLGGELYGSNGWLSRFHEHTR